MLTKLPNFCSMSQQKKVYINISLLDAIKQIPSYAKFLKDICTNKRRFEEHEQVMLLKNTSVVLQRKLPPKLLDPRSFTILCTIGKIKFDKALLDLGASVNLMPYSVYEQLGLGELKYVSISLQVADCSVNYPRGIVEDVLIHVDQLILHVDFVFLDIEEAEISGRELSLILGRPFMATVYTKIDVKSGLLTINVEDITKKFQVFEGLKRSLDPYDCFHVEVVDQIIEKIFIESSTSNPLSCVMESILARHPLSYYNIFVLCSLLDYVQVQEHNGWVPKYEVLPTVSDKTKSSREEAPKCGLKPLPAGLKYVFLREDETYLVVISSKLELMHEGM
ncbi:unnamed protein product [Prunus brigantina]